MSVKVMDIFASRFGKYPPSLRWIIVNYHSMDFFPIFIGWEPTTWPANNCLQIMVCSCVVPSKSVFAANNILLMRNSNHEKETNWFLPASCAYRFPKAIENKLGDRMIKQLLNSVIAKYRNLSVSRRSIIIDLICSPLTNHDIFLNLVQ